MREIQIGASADAWAGWRRGALVERTTGENQRDLGGCAVDGCSHVAERALRMTGTKGQPASGFWLTGSSSSSPLQALRSMPINAFSVVASQVSPPSRLPIRSISSVPACPSNPPRSRLSNAIPRKNYLGCGASWSACTRTKVASWHSTAASYLLWLAWLPTLV